MKPLHGNGGNEAAFCKNFNGFLQIFLIYINVGADAQTGFQWPVGKGITGGSQGQAIQMQNYELDSGKEYFRYNTKFYICWQKKISPLESTSNITRLQPEQNKKPELEPGF